MSAVPKVFISATFGDLRSIRQIVKEALLTIGCHPVEQTNSPPDWRTVEGMLRGSIEDCQALIHIAGLRYGAEPNPDTLPAGTPRRSYTQIEYHVGCQLHAERGDTGFRVYGEKGGLEWHQREPNTLLVKWPDQPMQVWRTANGYLGAAALAAGRTPPAHPEGYLEAFANIYQAFAATLRARLEKRKPTPLESDYPKITDGLRGMAFIEAVVASSKKNAAWTKLDV